MQDLTTPDKFRSEVVKHLKQTGQYFDKENRVKRIDGLNWYFYLGGGGCVMDDFGNRVSFEVLGEEKKYKVTELGPRRDEEKLAENVNELRVLVKGHFQSTWNGNTG